MPPKRLKYKIVKVALGYEPRFEQPNFEPVSRLFMELIENKAKVKEEVQGTEFESQHFHGGSMNETFSSLEQARQEVKKDVNEALDGHADTVFGSEPSSSQPIKESYRESSHQSPHHSHHQSPTASSKSENKFIAQYNKVKEGWTPMTSPKQSPSISISKSPTFEDSRYSPSHSPSANKNSFIIDNEEETLSSFANKSHNSEKSAPRSKSSGGEESYLERIMRGDVDDEEDNSPPVSSEMLSAYTSSSSSSHKSSNITPGASIATAVAVSSAAASNKPRVIPSLEDIANNRVPTSSSSSRPADPPAIANMTYAGTDKDLKRKRELLSKFKFLKSRHPDDDIPDVNEFMDIRELEREYEIIDKRIQNDKRLKNYKKFLIMGFFGMEFLLTTFMKFDDLKGFASQQSQGITQYEDILLEIGEKHQVSPSMQWPPELRLLGLVFMNAAIFLGSRALMKATGENVMNMFGDSNPRKGPIRQKSQKMKGPDIDLDDLDDLDTKKYA